MCTTNRKLCSKPATWAGFPEFPEAVRRACLRWPLLAAATLSLLILAPALLLPASTGQMPVFFVVPVAAAEVAVGLAIIVALYRARQTIHTDELTSLKG